MRKLLIIAMALAIPALAPAQVVWYDSFGFEPPAGYVPGPLPGQDGWLPDSTAGQSVPVVVADPTGLLSGQVAQFDAINGLGGWCGALVTPTGGADARLVGPIVHVEWDQVRVDTDDNFWHTPDFAGWSQFGLQWDGTGLLHSDSWAAGEPTGPITPLALDHIDLIYTGPPGATSITLLINGTNFGTAPTAGGTPVFVDWVFEMEDTAAGVSHGRLLMDNFRITVIPEPSIFLLAGLGLLALLRRRRK